MKLDRYPRSNATQLILLFVFSAGVAAAGTPPGQSVIDLQSYSDRARDAVRAELRKEKNPVDQLSVEVVGEPILLPEHAAMHYPSAAGQPTSVDEQPPEALVVVSVARGQDILWTSLVRFHSGKTEVEHVPRMLEEDNAPLSQAEWMQITKELVPLYDDALDITRGPERFYPYLPDDIRKYFRLGGEEGWWLFLPTEVVDQLSDSELRQLAALTLDTGAHLAWLHLEGYSVDPWFKDLPGGQLDNPQAVKTMMLQMSDVLKRMDTRLNERGALRPEHVALVRPYLRLALGEGGLRKKENPEELGSLPPSTTTYITRIATYAYIARLQGKLRIVYLVVAD